MTNSTHYPRRLLWLAIMTVVGCTGPTQYAGGPIAISTVDPLTRYQDFREARIEVASLQVLADDRVLIVLRYLNKTQRDFLIHLADSCHRSTAMVDDAGNEYGCSGTTGIESIYESGLSLPASSQVTASFRFDPPRQMLTKGTRFSFRSTQLLSVPVARGRAPVVARYSITLSEIEPRQRPAPSEMAPRAKVPSEALGAQTSSAYNQDFREARIEVASLQVLADDRVLIVLRYLNKTQRDFLIHLADSCHRSTAMVDDAGNEYGCSGTTGIESIYESGLSLPASSQVTASFRFDPPRQMLTKGTRFSFRSTQLLSVPLARGRPEMVARYGVTLADVNPIAFVEAPRVDISDYPQMRVELTNLQAMGGSISLEVRYVNKTQRDFLIHLADSCHRSTAMVDDAGNEYRCSGTTGIASNQGLSLPAGSQATASFRFDNPRQGSTKGTRFSFSSTHLLSIPVVRGNPEFVARYAVTLLRIELR